MNLLDHPLAHLFARIFTILLLLLTVSARIPISPPPNHAKRAVPHTQPGAKNSTPPSLTLNHVGISCHDLDAQIKWYGDVLGFNRIVLNYTALLPLFQTVQVMNPGGAVVELQKHSNSTRLSKDSVLNPLDRALYEGIFHVALKVQDLNGTLDSLSGQGVTIVSPPSCVPDVGCSGFVSDPEDNLVELVHYLFD